MTSASMQPLLHPPDGRPYRPVATLNGWSLPWRTRNGWKEFHLVAEPVRREIAPGMIANLWGYNGQSPGPTIECVEGDKVRIFVTNKLPEHTTIHWHGILLPNGMDGVGGLNQPQIPVGKTYVYEFAMTKSGTFMYHPHADEMVQMAMGLMGFIVVHPKDQAFMAVDRDFVFIINAYDIDPGSVHAADQHDARLQPLDVQLARVPGHRPAGDPEGRPRAHPHRQPDDDEPPDPHPRARLRGVGHRRRLGPEDRAVARGHRRRARWARCARSSSSPTRRATGRSTATRRTTR